MNIFERWRQSLLKSIQLQLFISCMSLPFLIAWGLPISIMTPISTLIFGPFLTCFLLLSSIIFFLELLYLPNGALVWCLEKVTSLWMSCLSLEQRTWLIGFSKPPLLVLFLIPLGALAIIHTTRITCIKQRISFFACFLIITCTALKLFPYHRNILEKIACNKGEITLMTHNKKVLLIDPGFIASRPSYESYISYTLVPTIIQKTGSLTIDHLIVGKCTKRMFDALQFLASKITIRDLYIPRWNGRIPYFAWRSYVKLKKIIAEQNGRIMSIAYKKKLYLDTTATVSIEPVATKEISYYDATYHPLCINGIINDQIVTVI